MKKTVIIFILSALLISCSSTKELVRLSDKIQYEHKIDSLKSEIALLRMKNTTDSLRQLLGFYKSKATEQSIENFKAMFTGKAPLIEPVKLKIDGEKIKTPDKKVFEKPNETGTFKDERDGQVYKWVKIGKQIWMAQNMNYMTHNGCWSYNDDVKNRNIYGLLYDFDQIKEVCPKGWHVPNEQEWEELETTISSGTADLNAGTGKGYNASCLLEGGESGFNILFAGKHSHGKTIGLGEFAWFWTSTRIDNPIHIIVVNKTTGYLGRNRIGSAYACSLRCVKDN
jgi:uncharacterized protein (TIGR02145 family)